MLSIRAAVAINPFRCITRIVSTIQLCKRDVSKLSYFHKPGKEPLLTWTVGDVIDRATDVFGDTTAMVYTHQSISKTYTEYGKDVDQLAAGLVSLKLPVGSRVAILAPRLYEGAQLLYAAPKAGLVMVGINLTCSVTELEFCLNMAECPALIIGDKFTTKDYYQMLLQIAPELENSSPGELNSKRLPFLKHLITIGDTRKPGSMTFDDLMNSVTAEDYATMNSLSTRVQFDQDAFIQYSSGTTGQPKPARLSHFNVVNNANILGRFVGYHEQRESICVNSELIHGSGRTMGVLAATLFGSTIVMAGPTFLPKLVLEVITKHRCTMVYGSTTLFFAMVRDLEEGVHDVSSVRKAIMGGSLCNPATIEKAIASLNAQHLYIVYGASETSPVITCTNPGEPTDRWIRTLGTPLDHVEVKVVDAEGRMVPWNMRGELCTRSPYVFNGYLNNEAMTKDAIRDNWYYTGDEVTMSEDGRITFVGRIKEMINFKGFKVAPLEIENILNTHPDVEEAQVLGVPDERTVEKICAWIKLKSDKSLSQKDITDFCEEKELPEIKVPEFVLFVDSFPRTHTGKVQKNKMREESIRIFNL
ncbi:acyl-CoA synthetase, putative [Ixodes scapularis]|uniref:Medium-chain acyl-CoA ligase ACSF2, mitochondrial n=1 Tax=Ixodes scapularis TaxID=6945 RepID=B7P431_IXOSC|nr:acyl-CoA synthetase, putative [Ixodes scapularis]|eukprot:XP_002405198.1 acyl-CoA synthetase, putative [Ixodes scapularis]